MNENKSRIDLWIDRIQLLMIIIALAILGFKFLKGRATPISFYALIVVSVSYIISLHGRFNNQSRLFRIILATFVSFFHLLVVIITRNNYFPVPETALIWCCITLLLFGQYIYEETVRILPGVSWLLGILCAYALLLTGSFGPEEILCLGLLPKSVVDFIQSTIFDKVGIAAAGISGVTFLGLTLDTLGHFIRDAVTAFTNNEEKSRIQRFHDIRITTLNNRHRSKVVFVCALISLFAMFSLAFVSVSLRKTGNTRLLLLNVGNIGLLAATFGFYKYRNIRQKSILNIENRYIKNYLPGILNGLTESKPKKISDTCTISINDETEDLIQIISHAYSDKSVVDSNNRKTHDYKNIISPLYLLDNKKWCSSRLLVFLTNKHYNKLSDNDLFDQGQKEKIEQYFSRELVRHFLSSRPSPQHSPVFFLLIELFDTFIPMKNKRKQYGRWSVNGKDISEVESLLFWDYLFFIAKPHEDEGSCCALNYLCTNSLDESSAKPTDYLSINKEIIKAIFLFPYIAMERLRVRWNNELSFKENVGPNERFMEERSTIACFYMLRLKGNKQNTPQKLRGQLRTKDNKELDLISISDYLVYSLQEELNDNELRDLITMAEELDTKKAQGRRWIGMATSSLRTSRYEVAKENGFQGSVTDWLTLFSDDSKKEEVEKYLKNNPRVKKEEIKDAVNEILKWCL